jgi:superfamily II DNA or RNA helicase
MNLSKTFYINGIRVETDPLGVKIFAHSKEQSDLIHKYYEEEFRVNGLTSDEERNSVLE